MVILGGSFRINSLENHANCEMNYHIPKFSLRLHFTIMMQSHLIMITWIEVTNHFKKKTLED